MGAVVLAISCLAAATGFALALFLALETLAAFLPARRREAAAPGPIVVVIPAHNESESIGATLANLRSQLREEDKVIVVADNCSDDTAARARTAGAETIERQDAMRRGKGYALQFALDHLRAAPPAIVLFMDADCLFAEGALQRVAGAAAGAGRPAQALYLMKAPADAGPRLKVAEFAWAFMNHVRMRGLQRLFGVTRFTGAGLAAPWRVIESIDLASGEIVEDLALTFQLARKDAPPFLVEDAVIESEFPTDEAALTRQAARWSIGSLRYAARSSLSALGEGAVRAKPPLIGAAIDLMIPPLTIFMTALGAAAALGVAAWIWTGEAMAFLLAAWALLLAGMSVVAGWYRFGQTALPPDALHGAFDFLLSKLNVFGAKGRQSAKGWTPTRGGDGGDA
jgi:hypothetical protein